MGNCQICGANGFGVKSAPCQRCSRNLCERHRMYIPVVQQTLLLEALQGGGGMFNRSGGPQAAQAWMANPSGAPKNWQEFRIFCTPPCASEWIATLTPSTVQGPQGAIPILTFTEFSSSGQSMKGMQIDYSRGVNLGGLFAVVESNLHPDLRPSFKRRTSGGDVRDFELARAKNAWESGDFKLAAEIYEKQGYPQFAAQARELANTSHVVQTNITVDYNRMMDQLKELRKPIAYSCPKCGAGAIIDQTTGKDSLKCKYCGTTFAIPDIQKAIENVTRGTPGVPPAPPPPQGQAPPPPPR